MPAPIKLLRAAPPCSITHDLMAPISSPEVPANMHPIVSRIEALTAATTDEGRSLNLTVAR